MRRSRLYFFVLLALWLLYVLVGLTSPLIPATEQLHISPIIFLLLRLSIYLPFLLILVAGFLSWFYLGKYASQLSNISEQCAFRMIANGLIIITFGLVTSALVGAIRRSHYVSSPDMVEAAVVLNNYGNVIFPLLGFFLMWRGSRKLTKIKALKQNFGNKILTVFVPAVIFGLFYIALFFTNPSRQASANPDVLPTYFLPDNILIATIVAPVILTWMLGLSAALNIESFTHKLSSPAAKKGLIKLYNGILVIICSLIIQQALTSLGATRLSALTFGLILIIVYVLIAFMVSGYVMVALSAKALVASSSQESRNVKP